MHLEKLRKFFFVWTVGLLGRLFFLLLVAFGGIKVTGYDRKKLDHKGRGLVIIGNHPDLWTPFLLPFLFASPRWLLFPEEVPRPLVDKNNYHVKKWFRFFLFHLFAIPIERGNRRKELETMKNVLRPALKAGKTLILFPEGTRTFLGIERNGGKYTSHGEIARFPQGLSKLFEDMDCLLLFVWTKGGEKVMPNERDFSRTISKFLRFWHQPHIRVGESLELPAVSGKEVISWLEDTLLALSEHEETKQNFWQRLKSLFK